jgi:hypothetical protein
MLFCDSRQLLVTEQGLSIRKLAWGAFALVALVVFALIQFIPAPALVVPAQLPAEQRAPQSDQQPQSGK